MNAVDLNYEVEISDPDLEIDVEIDYKCYFEPLKHFKMTKYSSIHKGETLQQSIADGIKHYEREGYDPVGVIEVRVDTDALIAELNKKKP